LRPKEEIAAEREGLKASMAQLLGVSRALQRGTATDRQVQGADQPATNATRAEPGPRAADPDGTDD
jgi:hypothetical protein